MFTVCGRVGFVDDGNTFGCDATVMMSGACPPPAPSVWKVWIDLPAIAASVLVDVAGLVERVGVDRHLHARRIGHAEAGIDRRGGRAPVLVELEP